MHYSLSSIGQKEDHMWIFNSTRVDDLTDWPQLGASIIDFNNLPPLIYRNETITLDFGECHSSVCEENGKLLFYSNGQSIHGSNHIPVINGEKINYSSKWEWLTWENENGEVKPQGFRYPQAVGFFKIPNIDSNYLALYHNYENSCEGYGYELWNCLISKNDSGDFELTKKDEVLKRNLLVPGSIHSCTHANGRDQWMLQFSSDSVYTYLIDSSGINLNHTKHIPFILREAAGQSKFSPQGERFALYGHFQAQSNNGMDLMISDFDRCSGFLIDPKYSRLSSSGANTIDNGLEFSPNGNLLYISKKEKITQFDLLSNSVFDTETVVSNYDSLNCDLGGGGIFFGQIQLGPDGKIYIANTFQCFDLATIEYPNKVGVECEVVQNAIKLPTYHQGTIPNFNTLRLGPIDGSPCDTLDLNNNPILRFWYEQDNNNHQEIQFRDVSYYRPEEWAWTFGDGNSSDEKSPLHEYDSNGVYEVCLTVSNENSSNTSCQEIQIGPVANQNIHREYDINIFPNPVEDVTRLVFHDYLPEQAQIISFDASGQKVFSARVYQECVIDLSGLNAEAYLYEILDGGDFLQGGKIVKM